MSILIVGDLMIDHWIVGRAQAKICQEAPIPIYDAVEDIYLPGGAGNLAMNVKAMGAEYKLLCPIGNPTGNMFDDTKDNYVSIDGYIVTGGNILYDNGIVYDNTICGGTTYKNRLVCDDYLISRWDHNYILIEDEAKNYQKLVLDNMNEYTTMVITDYNKGAISRELLGCIVNTYDGNIILDPYSGRDYEYWEDIMNWRNNDKVTIIPNSLEMDMVDDRGTIEYLTSNHCNVVIKAGRMGCFLYRPNVEWIDRLHIPSVATTVRSVVGAGDTVTAAIGVCIDRGIGLEEACGYAMDAAAEAISYPLTCVTTRKIK